MPHVVRKPGALAGGTLAVFLALVHFVNDAITAILGALLPTLQERFDVGSTTLALLVATYWVASSLTQPLLGALAEDVGFRAVAAGGVLFAALFLSLVGVAPALWLVFALLVIGGVGSAALHPVGSAIAAASRGNAAVGVGLFTAGGMIGFALGPVLILYLVSRWGVGATPWLIVPGAALAVGVATLLPDWQPHGRRRLAALFDWSLLRGPIGGLALAGGFSAAAFVTFTSGVPLWLAGEKGYASDAPLIGWTLAAFSLAAAGGAVLGGVLAPRIGRPTTVVGALALAVVPLVALLALDPGSVAFFAAAVAAGALLYIPSSVKVAIAQELAPAAPAAASGVILGTTAAVGGALYVALGKLQDAVGVEAGMVAGFGLVVPAALVAAAVLARPARPRLPRRRPGPG